MKRSFIRRRLSEVHQNELKISYELSELIHESNESILEKVEHLRVQCRLRNV
jgi:hypothetical protein